MQHQAELLVISDQSSHPGLPRPHPLAGIPEWLTRWSASLQRSSSAITSPGVADANPTHRKVKNALIDSTPIKPDNREISILSVKSVGLYKK
jgi:hypothetical protein